jgi:hypothetical protein
LNWWEIPKFFFKFLSKIKLSILINQVNLGELDDSNKHSRWLTTMNFGRHSFISFDASKWILTNWATHRNPISPRLSAHHVLWMVNLGLILQQWKQGLLSSFVISITSRRRRHKVKVISAEGNTGETEGEIVIVRWMPVAIDQSY